MKAVSLIFRKLSDTDFKNISGQGGVEGGGGQGYIDISTSGVDDESMKKFLGKETEMATQGPSWNFPVASLSLDVSTQNLKIYKRRSTSFCIASQKIGTSASNRVSVWSPSLTGFPEKKYSEEKRPLVVYIIKDDQKKYWAGWFYKDEYDASWVITPDLARLFCESCGYVELDNVVFDVNVRTWPFALDKHETKAMMRNELKEKKSFNRLVFGAPGTGKSYKINDESELFKNQDQTKINYEELLKSEISKASGGAKKLNCLNGIGFRYADELKNLSKKDISEKYSTKNADELYVGANAKAISEKIDVNVDNDADEIKRKIQEAKTGKNMIINLNAIGYRYSDYLFEKTLNQLKDDYELTSDAQIWWLYRGAQAGQINLEKKTAEIIDFVERVTFHPNYSYSQFVGTYKPVQDEEDRNLIRYEYVPGPFVRVYENAIKNPDKDFLLIIEEINRANVAAVFGDVFQLLDRKNGVSEYPVTASEDIKRYLQEKGVKECNKLTIPSNMYIWATMNSADQGVFPMDTAFKRRWEFEYVGINEKESDVARYYIPTSERVAADGTVTHKWVKWNDLRKNINNKLISLGINEDKLLGPFFINEEKLKSVDGRNEGNAKSFIESFKSKVLMYLFEDVVKMKPAKLFTECGEHPIYSIICEKFNEIGEKIFGLELPE